MQRVHYVLWVNLMLFVLGGCADDETSPPAKESESEKADMGPERMDQANNPESDVCRKDERVSMGVCVACSPGTINIEGDDAGGVDTLCDAVLCNERERVELNSCTECLPGYTNQAGDDASMGNTQCEAALCEQDERVQANACVSCLSGTTNTAGDNATGMDTLCDASRCPSDTSVVSNQCVACPAGTTREAGDDPSGADTQCEAILCGQDERVDANQCVACVDGSRSMGGDDASGSDTQCSDPCLLALSVSCSEFEQSYIKASNATSRSYFGASVVLSGDTLVVSAPDESNSATGVDAEQSGSLALNSGAVYVFTRIGSAWSQQAYIKASNTREYAYFGTSMALSGDTLVVGAPGESSNATGVDADQSDDSATNSGAAYVFVRDGGAWSQQAYIKASNTGASDDFGQHVALSGDTLAVGAPGEYSSATGVGGDQSDNSADAVGAAYVFVRDGGVWSQQAYIKASNAELGDTFGDGMALSGDTLVVGAPGESSNATGVGGDQSDNSADAVGAAYVFVRDGGVWSQQAYIKASNAKEYNFFGTQMAMSNNTIVIGTSTEDSNATGAGGDPLDSSAPYSGAVYVFVRNGSVWSQQAYIKSLNAEENDEFGEGVALSGDMLIVGAPGEASNAMGVGGNQSDNSANASGAVYVYTRAGDVWSQHAYIKASNTGAGDDFGQRVALSEGTLVVGAPGEGSSAKGVGGDQSDDSSVRSGAAYVRKIKP